MRFLLIRAGNKEKGRNFFTASPSTYPPLGLMYIGAILEQDGHNVEILDYYMENISREQLGKILMSVDAVGMNVHTNDLKLSNDIAKMIKDFDSDIPLIIGGPHCTFFQERSLKDITSADISVMGEGEKVILEIAKFIQGQKKPSNINGIYYRNNGSIISGRPIQVINNLDDVPFPSRHLVEKYDYGDFPFGFKLKKKVTAMITSRGCPSHCRFCTRYGNIIDGWGFRQRSAENVLQEFREIDDNYASMIIVDDNFLEDRKRAHKIFDGLIESGRETELVIMGTRVDSANKQLYQKMKQAGVKYLNYGIESGNQDVLDYYNKNISLEQIQETIELARKMKFFTLATFILGAPIETKKHIENTIKFACSLPLDVAVFGPLAYIKGSQLWKEEVEGNNELEEKLKDGFLVFADSKKGLGNLTVDELVKYTIMAFKSFYFRPTYILSQIYRCIIRNDYNLLINGLNYLFSVKRIGNRK